MEGRVLEEANETKQVSSGHLAPGPLAPPSANTPPPPARDPCPAPAPARPPPPAYAASLTRHTPIPIVLIHLHMPDPATSQRSAHPSPARAPSARPCARRLQTRPPRLTCGICAPSHARIDAYPSAVLKPAIIVRSCLNCGPPGRSGRVAARGCGSARTRSGTRSWERGLQAEAQRVSALAIRARPDRSPRAFF